MLIRHGVQLTPVLADAFDLFAAAGERGILPEVLKWTLFPDKSKENVKTTINRINDAFCSTDIRIEQRDGRNTAYRLTGV